MASVLSVGVTVLALAASLAARSSFSPNLELRDQPAARTASISGGAMILVNGQLAPVRRARVTLQGTTSSKPQGTDTDTDGRYRFDGLAAGSYRVTIEKPGFVPAA